MQVKSEASKTGKDADVTDDEGEDVDEPPAKKSKSKLIYGIY